MDLFFLKIQKYIMIKKDILQSVVKEFQVFIRKNKLFFFFITVLVFIIATFLSIFLKISLKAFSAIFLLISFLSFPDINERKLFLGIVFYIIALFNLVVSVKNSFYIVLCSIFFIASQLVFLTVLETSQGINKVAYIYTFLITFLCITYDIEIITFFYLISVVILIKNYLVFVCDSNLVLLHELLNHRLEIKGTFITSFENTVGSKTGEMISEKVVLPILESGINHVKLNKRGWLGSGLSVGFGTILWVTNKSHRESIHESQKEMRELLVQRIQSSSSLNLKKNVENLEFFDMQAKTLSETNGFADIALLKALPIVKSIPKNYVKIVILENGEIITNPFCILKDFF